MRSRVTLSLRSTPRGSLAGLASAFLLLASSACTRDSGVRLLTPGPQFPAVIRPLDGSVGSVVLINERLRFVVLDYSLSSLPPTGSSLGLYRGSLRVGQVRLSRWSGPTTAAADIVEGAPRVGDVARPE